VPEDYYEHVFGSANWEFRKVKVNRPPGASKDSGGAGGTTAQSRFGFWPLARADWRKPIKLTVTYRGGPECWVEIHSRGRIGRYPGYVAIVDILGEITRNRP
jgi:hypothetical protein